MNCPRKIRTDKKDDLLISNIFKVSILPDSVDFSGDVMRRRLSF